MIARVRGLRHRPDPSRAWALVIPSLDVEGPRAVVVGRSGSGKTTLLELLLGLEKPEEGDLHLLGSRVEGADSTPFGEIGYLPQFPERLLFRESAWEEVRVSATAAGLVGEERERRVRDCLEAVGLAAKTEGPRSPQRLSFGQRRRLALASVLAWGPRLLVLDEPTAGLDLDGYEAVRRVLEDQARGGGAFLLATQDLALAEEAGTEFHLLGGESEERSAGSIPRSMLEHLTAAS